MGKHGRDRVTIGWGCIWVGTGSGRPAGQPGSRVMPGSMVLRLQFSGRSVISLSNSSAGDRTDISLGSHFLVKWKLPTTKAAVCKILE